MQFRDDVYGRDRTLLALLKGDDRKMADVAIERRDDISHRQVLALPDSTPLWGGRNYGGPGDGAGFFSRIFGSFAAPPAPVPPRQHAAAQRRKETRSGNTVQR
jgi:hypothetical protein